MKKLVLMLIAATVVVGTGATIVDQKVTWMRGGRFIKKGEDHPGLRNLTEPIRNKHTDKYGERFVMSDGIAVPAPFANGETN